METESLLSPYITCLTQKQLDQVSTYVDLLLRWNAKMNLTAVREPQEIVTRHFGESLYLSQHVPVVTNGVTDVGSGAGFPGIPLKIARPDIKLTLIEAQQKKATFLREVLRALNLEAEVKNVRAEDVAQVQPNSADLVTLRAVEKFESILPVAARLVREASVGGSRAGVLALLVGSAQVPRAKELLPGWRFDPEISIPGAQNRVILKGTR